MHSLQTEDCESIILPVEGCDSEFKIIPETHPIHDIASGQKRYSISTIAQLNERIGCLSQTLEEFALSAQENDLVVEKYLHALNNNEDSDQLVTHRNSVTIHEHARRSIKQFSGVFSSISTRSDQKPSALLVDSSYRKLKQPDQNFGKKPCFVEVHEFPGFDEAALTPLPLPCDADYIFNIVTRAQLDLNAKLCLKKEFVRFLRSMESCSILHDCFWWHFNHKYQSNKDFQEKLFRRISSNFTQLVIQWTNTKFCDTLFKRYPDTTAQAIYATYCHSFPASYRKFNSEFRDELLNLVTLWMLGTKPPPASWKEWSFSDLEPEEMRKGERMHEDTAKSATFDFEQHFAERTMSHRARKMSVYQQRRQRLKSIAQTVSRVTTHAGLNSRLTSRLPLRDHLSARQADFELTSPDHSALVMSPRQQSVAADSASNPHRKRRSVRIDPAEKSSTRLESVDQKWTMKRTSLKDGEKQEPPCSNAVNRKSSVVRILESKGKFQSCPAGRGAEFAKVVFDICGRSPLVEYFLQSRNLSQDVGTSVLIQRTEVVSLPPLLTPTYKDVIDSTKASLSTRIVQFQRTINERLVERRKCSSQRRKADEEFKRCMQKILSIPTEVKKLSDLLYIRNEREDSADLDLRMSMLQSMLSERLSSSFHRL